LAIQFYLGIEFAGMRTAKKGSFFGFGFLLILFGFCIFSGNPL